MTNVNGTLIVNIIGGTPPPSGGTYKMIITPNPVDIFPGATVRASVAVEYPDGTIGPPTPGATMQAFWQTAAVGVTFALLPNFEIELVVGRNAPIQSLQIDVHLSAVGV